MSRQHSLEDICVLSIERFQLLSYRHLSRLVFRMTLCGYRTPNDGVDATAQIQSGIAGRIKLRNTLPPLASNDLLGFRHCDHVSLRALRTLTEYTRPRIRAGTKPKKR